MIRVPRGPEDDGVGLDFGELCVLSSTLSSNQSFRPSNANCGFLRYVEAGPNPQAPAAKVQSSVVRTNCMDSASSSHLTSGFSALMRRIYLS